MILTIDEIYNQPSLAARYEEILDEIWPQIIKDSKVVQRCGPYLLDYFADHQLFLLDSSSDIIGFILTVPFYWNKPLQELPDEGWDWLVERGISDYENNIRPNAMGGLQVGIAKKHQGKGYSTALINLGKQKFEEMNYQHFVIPIRPTQKYQHPHIQMTEYKDWRKDGKIYDPWIRVHVRCGASIIKVCHTSMTVTGKYKYWEKLSGQALHNAKEVVVPGALNPIKLDGDLREGIYKEENIWVSYV